MSGKFKEENDQKQEKIASDNRNTCDKKFWKTHNYDFIKVKSYDPKAQSAYERHSEAIERVQGVAQAGRFPRRCALSSLYEHQSIGSYHVVIILLSRYYHGVFAFLVLSNHSVPLG